MVLGYVWSKLLFQGIKCASRVHFDLKERVKVLKKASKKDEFALFWLGV